MLKDEQDGIALCVYYSAELNKTAAQTMDTAKKALRLFNGLFGGYPYDTLNIVVNNLAGGVNGMQRTLNGKYQGKHYMFSCRSLHYSFAETHSIAARRQKYRLTVNPKWERSRSQ